MGKVVKFPQKGGEATRKKVTPVDQRLVQMGKSRQWLATQVGVSVTTIGNYARGKSPDLNNFYLRRMLKVLAIDENQLLGLRPIQSA